MRYLHGCTTPGRSGAVLTSLFLCNPLTVASWHPHFTAKFVWLRIVVCQRFKVNRHVRAPVPNFCLPSRRFAHVHVDVVTPLPPSQGFTHLLTVVDHFTWWLEAIPVTNTSALSLARALLQNWVSRFGTPQHITSDRGSQFTSTLWSQLSTLLGTELYVYGKFVNGDV